MKYRIAAVSYINTLPFIQGLRSALITDEVEVVLAHPARCAEMLQKDEVDIALCPVGALEDMNGYHIITDYCIGCDGPVRTVSVYSHHPLDEISHVVLSPESRTSNLLVRVLDREYWKNDINFISGSPVSESVEGPTSLFGRPNEAEAAISPTSPTSPAFLHIGDICFQKEKEYPYRIDLGQVWKDWTGLPFVFACWVSKNEIENDFIEKLNAVFGQVIQNIDKLDSFPNGIGTEMMQKYLKKNISYELNEEKVKGMKRFLQLVNESEVGNLESGVSTRKSGVGSL